MCVQDVQPDSIMLCAKHARRTMLGVNARHKMLGAKNGVHIMLCAAMTKVYDVRHTQYQSKNAYSHKIV